MLLSYHRGLQPLWSTETFFVPLHTKENDKQKRSLFRPQIEVKYIKCSLMLSWSVYFTYFLLFLFQARFSFPFCVLLLVEFYLPVVIYAISQSPLCFSSQLATPTSPVPISPLISAAVNLPLTHISINIQFPSAFTSVLYRWHPCFSSGQSPVLNPCSSWDTSCFLLPCQHFCFFANK